MKATIQVFETIRFEHEIEIEIEDDETLDELESELADTELQCVDDILMALRFAKIPVTSVCEGGGDPDDFEWYIN